MKTQTLDSLSKAYIAKADLKEAFYMPSVVIKEGLHPGLKGFPIFANLADAVSTHVALNNGAREANPVVEPITRSLPLFYAFKLGVGLATSLGASKLYKDGHHTSAKILSIIGGAVPLGAAIHNTNVIRKL